MLCTKRSHCPEFVRQSSGMKDWVKGVTPLQKCLCVRWESEVDTLMSLLVMTPFVYPLPVCRHSFTIRLFSRASLSLPQINLLETPSLFPFSCVPLPLNRPSSPCSFYPGAYQTPAAPKMWSLPWLSGRVHVEVGGNSPGLIQTAVVRKSLRRITRMWSMPGFLVLGMSVQCAISTFAC